MVNNSTNINNIKNHLLAQIIEQFEIDKVLP